MARSELLEDGCMEKLSAEPGLGADAALNAGSAHSYAIIG